jgi:hypothetical protein
VFLLPYLGQESVYRSQALFEATDGPYLEEPPATLDRGPSVPAPDDNTLYITPRYNQGGLGPHPAVGFPGSGRIEESSGERDRLGGRFRSVCRGK